MKGFKDFNEEFDDYYLEMDTEEKKNKKIIEPYLKEIEQLKEENKKLKQKISEIEFEDFEDELFQDIEKETSKSQKIVNNTVKEVIKPDTQNISSNEIKLFINGLGISLDFGKK
jgi:DNA replicative helicase MCM subunit Mcm2 (Cdc46/Mcm family)